MPMTPESLLIEGRYLYRRLMGGEPAAAILERYVQANLHCFVGSDPAEQARIDLFIEHQVDIEAVEYIWRLQKRSNLLSRKVQCLMYLVETRKDFYDRFFNDDVHLVQGKLVLVGEIARSFWMLAKGLFLAWKVPIV
jgi:hypothetical protein